MPGTVRGHRKNTGRKGALKVGFSSEPVRSRYNFVIVFRVELLIMVEFSFGISRRSLGSPLRKITMKQPQTQKQNNPSSCKILTKTLLCFMAAMALAAPSVEAANIVLVSDNPPTTAADNTWQPAIVGYPDDWYVTVLSNAGHNVVRFNPPNSQNTLLTAAQIAALNTNDLILIGRSINSGGFQAPQSTNWNTRITKPIICTSPYLVRSDGNRLNWFGGGAGVLPDTAPPTRLRGVDPLDPETDFLFGGVTMRGDLMVDSYDETLERNTSVITNPLQPGGKSLAQATFVPLAGGAAVTGHFVAELPAGTAIPAASGGTLAGYRMFLAATTREASDIPLGAARDNLTPAGEDIFMRAIRLALNNGVTPDDVNAPLTILAAPTDRIVPENTSVTFTADVTGGFPRTVEWQRDTGDGVTFTNIPGSSTPFRKSALVLPNVTPADDGALFRLSITTPGGTITSTPAELTVVADTIAPTIVRSVGKWTMTNVTVSFSEPVTALSANDSFAYTADNGLFIDSATLDATGTNVLLATSVQVPGTVYTITVNGIQDRASVANEIAPDSTTSFTAWIPSQGFWISEIFTGITGNAVSMLLTNVNYPNFPAQTRYLNISSNPPAAGENYGGRLVGTVTPPVSGDYIFFIRGDDGTELRLSPNAESAGRVTIASQTAANGAFTAGASAPQALVAGQSYFVEALWKEGTGGDYVQVAWQLPGSTNIEAIAHSALTVHADPTGATTSITAQPQNTTVTENRSAVLSVSASTTPTSALRSYLWQRGDGVGGFTNVPSANSATLTTARLAYPDDNASQWRVIVSTPGASATSEVAVVTVEDDLVPPVVTGMGSVDGVYVGICFDELVNPTMATDSFNYDVNGGASILSIVLRPDGRSVRLQMETPITGAFNVTVTGVEDLAGNALDSETLAATVVGLAGANLGAPLATGDQWSCADGSFEVLGGGADIFGTADTGYYSSRTVTGDFDAKVRVTDLTLTSGTGGALIAKAGLMVRNTSANNSPTLWLLANAPPPGRDLIEAGARATSGGATGFWGPNETNIHMPNLWVRITRSGNLFNGYASANGVDWTLFATTNQSVPASLLVGVAVTAHNDVAGLVSTGRFSNFSITQPIADVSITQSASPLQVGVGDQVTYTLIASNAGPDAANLVTVSNPLPPGGIHVSSAASQGACSVAAGVVTCNLGALASGGSATVTLVVRMSTTGSITNTATVASAAVDSSPLNNTSSSVVRVVSRPQLSAPSYNGGAGTFSLSIATEDGVAYRVQYKNELSDATWQTLQIINGNGSVQPVTDPGPLPPTRFYRVIVDPIVP